MVAIHENYQDYSPPIFVRKTVSKLLSRLPEPYLSGLEAVVLTNAVAIGKGKTRRVGIRKYKRNECLGFYHHKSKGEVAWIEIVVDNIIASSFGPQLPRFLRYIPPVREGAFGTVLYHEMGHHLDHTIGPLGRGSESSADAWRDKLLVAYFIKNYWYLKPFLAGIKAVARYMARLDESERRKSVV